MPAGGHQGYAALGGLYTQCRPLVPHLYGSVDDQEKYSPVSISLCTILLEVLHPHVDIGVHSSKLLLIKRHAFNDLLTCKLHVGPRQTTNLQIIIKSNRSNN